MILFNFLCIKIYYFKMTQGVHNLLRTILVCHRIFIYSVKNGLKVTQLHILSGLLYMKLFGVWYGE